MFRLHSLVLEIEFRAKSTVARAMSSAQFSVTRFSFENIIETRANYRLITMTEEEKSLEEADRQNPTKNEDLEQKPREKPPGKIIQHPCSSRRRVNNTNSNKESDNQERHTLSTFCTKCQYLFDHWHDASDNIVGKEFPFHSDISFMKSSGMDGCLLCSQFLGILGCGNLLQDSGINQAISSLLVIPRSNKYWEICLHQEKIESEILAFFMNTGKSRLGEDHMQIIELTKLDGDGPSVGISHENTSREALPLVKQWLYNCCMMHDRCSTIEKMFLPTRLIFIGDSLPRLMQATEIKGYPKYATLSHCWGKLKSLVLRQDNVETFATRIPQEALPQSFEDAIEVARSLDIDYLWIDSLCIIQNNDSDDWAKEAAQMSSIYGGSYLNIAATSAVDGSKGFLSNEYSCNSGFRARISTSHGDTSCICVPSNLYRDSISSSPLAQRGWVVQERLLAPRTVHFTSRQVFWECNGCVACEAFPVRLPDVFKYSEAYLRKRPLLEYSWKEIVQQYSRGSLTRSRDKIVAISGISRAAQHTQRFGYLAGLWRSNLIFQLCWKRTSNIAPPPVEYRGPSWSWVSVDSGVTLVSGPLDSDTTKSTTLYAQVVDTYVGLAGPDPFGEVSSANLYLNCKALYPISSSAELPDSSGSVYMMAWGIYIRATISLDSSGRNRKRPLYLLPIMSRVVDILDYSIPSMINGEVEGLLLEPTEISPGCYQRVGHFILECDKYTKSAQHLFFAEILEANPISPSHYSEIQREADGAIKHIITLI